MNFLGHAHVALAVGVEDRTSLLGVVIADLATMAGVRIRRADADGALADGMRLHLVTDAAFHADSTFVAGMVALREDLLAAGARPGSARAIAHVGWELLLDGTLVGAAAEAGFWQAMAVADQASAVVVPAGRDRWRAFVGRWDGPRPVLRYDDPLWVADRVHAMLQRRPRLAFGADQVATVASVLQQHQGQVQTDAGAVLEAAVYEAATRS